MEEIIIDNFAGGGGASTGIEKAIGKSPDIAINHDPEAIRMHMTNHPDTEHYCEDVWDVDPIEACKGRKVGLAWFSPDCKHFSKAKGGTPVTKKIRGLAWVAVNWAMKVKPRVIMLENVEEFKTWGPLTIDENGDSYPDPDRKGETFEEFVAQLESLGYEVQFRELRACDYGAPTIRKRFFLIARCDGNEIVWPEATHGYMDSIGVRNGELKPYRTAADIIDWSLPCPSIFESKEEIKNKYGLRVKRPLAENTLKRIAAGIQKFVVENPDPFIVQVNHSGVHDRCTEISKPLNTITAKHGYGIVVPYIASYHTQKKEGEHRGQSTQTPINTIDTNPRYSLVAAFISKYSTGDIEKASSHTEAAWNHNTLVTSNLIQFNNSCVGQKVDEHVNTVTAGGNHFGEVRAFLMTYYGNEDDLGQKMDEPLRTVTSKPRFGIVTVKGVDYRIIDIGLRMLQARELYDASGFPHEYIIDHDYEGNKITKEEQVKRCGNAVPPQFSEVLVRANIPELCEQKKTA